MNSVRLLRWVYLGRLTLAAGIFGGALLVWPSMSPKTTLLITLILLVSLAFTLASFWYTHILGRAPARNFLYGQVVFDTLLVTLVVHVTGGAESDFAPLYIVVIAAGALLLPLPGGVLIGALASLLYFVDSAWLHALSPPPSVFLQIGLFSLVALVTGALGDRLRRTGTALNVVESELRQLRLDTGDILSTMDTGVVTTDERGRLVYINPAAESLLDLRDRTWLGREVVEELDRRAPGLGRAVRRTAEIGMPIRRYETRASAPEDERVLGVRTTVLEREESPWVTAVFQDITDGKRVEELNRRAERLQAVAELSASLAHEIKNPLASIRSAVEQLSGEQLGADDRELLRRLVTTESDRLSRILSEFIEFSRVQIRRSETVDLERITQQVIQLVRRHPAAAGDVRVELEQSTMPIRVPGDEDLLHRAIFNLTLNGVQHAGESGRVRVRIGRVGVLDLPEGVDVPSPVRIEVGDTGPGISSDDIARIFDPFFTTRNDGTGLGLALVHRAVEAHRGAVFVDNTPAGGARFTVYLPAEEKESA